MSKELEQIAIDVVEQMHRQNTDAALQAVVELMLTDRSPKEVVDALRTWADYLDEYR